MLSNCPCIQSALVDRVRAAPLYLIAKRFFLLFFPSRHISLSRELFQRQPASDDNSIPLDYDAVLIDSGFFGKGEVVGQSSLLEHSTIKSMPKVLLHEHLDCSLRTSTMLEFWQEEQWKVPANFPASIRELYESGEHTAAAAAYQEFLSTEAGSSLANYVAAIVHHVLPLMRTSSRLARITRERIEDAVSDGVIALELRFAPQLHIQSGLTLEQVMEAVSGAIIAAPIPVRLIVCALRHEDASLCRRLVDLAIAFKDHVGVFDLAGDEKANPGVLLWWAKEAVRVKAHGIQMNVHLWETDEPQDEDLVRLAEFEILRLGHGMRGQRQENRILEVCPSSNVLTGQISSWAEHPIDSLLQAGKRVTVNTDGTLFTNSDLSNEYLLLNRHFGWGSSEFRAVNMTAIEASSFPQSTKQEVVAALDSAYRD